MSSMGEIELVDSVILWEYVIQSKIDLLCPYITLTLDMHAVNISYCKLEGCVTCVSLNIHFWKYLNWLLLIHNGIS